MPEDSTTPTTLDGSPSIPLQVRPQPPETDPEQMAGTLGIHPLVARILQGRGVTTADQAELFLHPSLAQLLPPGGLTDVGLAASLLADAVQERAKVIIHGDYDADGITSTALLYKFLQTLHADVEFRIPHRIADGYGLTPEAVTASASAGCRVLVTVDCGIASHEEIRLARSLGLDVVVVDHHPAAGDELPQANAVVNAQRRDCGFAERVLAAVGTVFHLVVALRQELRERGHFKGEAEPLLRPYLDLVALGTVADMVPLTGQNRVMVGVGLLELARTSRPGIRALMEVAGCRTPINSWVVGFQLAPRLNAAGRLGDAERAVRLLITDDHRQAYQLAVELQQENRRRQELGEQIFQQARQDMEAAATSTAHATPGNKSTGAPVCTFLYRRGWHPGVLGIVASRLVDATGTPAVVLGVDDNSVGKGSARSIPGVDIGRALVECSDLMIAAGGHEGAAGLTVMEDRIPRLRALLEGKIREQMDNPAQDANKVGPVADLQVKLSELVPELIDNLSLLEPFGAGNPEPLFAACGLKVTNHKVFKERHVRCRLRDETIPAPGIDAVGFDMAGSPLQAGALVDALFVPRWNDFGRTRTLELWIKEVLPSPT